MSIPSPFTNSDTWDRLTIRASVKGKETKWDWENTNVDFTGDIENEWDVQKAAGRDGAPAKDKGYKACDYTVTWGIYTEELWQMFASFVEGVRPRPGKDPKPIITIAHPLPQLYSVSVVRLQKLPFITHKGGGLWEAGIHVMEYFPDPKPVKKEDPQPPRDDYAAVTVQRELPSRYKAATRPGNGGLPSSQVTPARRR